MDEPDFVETFPCARCGGPTSYSALCVSCEVERLRDEHNDDSPVAMPGGFEGPEGW